MSVLPPLPGACAPIAQSFDDDDDGDDEDDDDDDDDGDADDDDDYCDGE